MRALSAAAGFQGRRLNEGERRSLDAALRYFREAAPKHNADEEESLFPRLRLLPDLEVRRVLADLARLEQEHHWAVPLHLEVDRVGRQWLAHDELDKDEAQTFRTSVEKLFAMYRTHIEFEDTVLFPLARRVLTAVQTAEIATEMAKRQNLEI